MGQGSRLVQRRASHDRADTCLCDPTVDFPGGDEVRDPDGDEPSLGHDERCARDCCGSSLFRRTIVTPQNDRRGLVLYCNVSAGLLIFNRSKMHFYIAL